MLFLYLTDTKFEKKAVVGARALYRQNLSKEIRDVIAAIYSTSEGGSRDECDPLSILYVCRTRKLYILISNKCDPCTCFMHRTKSNVNLLKAAEKKFMKPRKPVFVHLLFLGDRNKQRIFIGSPSPSFCVSKGTLRYALYNKTGTSRV